MLTQQEKTIIRDSFARVAPIAEVAAMLFYKRLFELAPSMRPMFFRSPIEEQGRKLMQTLAAAVRSLDHMETLIEPLRKMGRRHVDYGVREEHYDTVAEALLWTLEQGLGSHYTPAVREAWAKVYGLLAGVMKEGARQCAETQAMTQTA